MTNTNENVMEKIDQLDRKILQIITQNARMPFKDVAETCGVSRAAIHQRVQRLIDIDVITGSGYTVNPKMLGFQMCAYIGITLERGSMYKEVVHELEKIPEIVESQYTLGSYTILIKLYAKNDEHLMELLNGKIQEIPGVATTETLTSLDQRIKRTIPIE
jgi:Lrp/AsnC family transcriptional regulator for asnA, asnC and gidA